MNTTPVQIGRDAQIREQVTLRLADIATFMAIESPDVPKMSLDRLTHGDLSNEVATWGLWGQRHAATSARTDLAMYNGESDTVSALSHAVDHEMEQFFLALAVDDMVDALQERYTRIRDTARQQHSTFKPKYLDELQHTFLTQSVDLTSSKNDVAQWWRNQRKVPQFTLRFLDDEEDEEPPALDFTEHIRSRQLEGLSELEKSDQSIREVLATVASLGSSRRAHRVSVIALAIAAMSVVVAITNLLLSTPNHYTVVDVLKDWLQH